METFRLRFTSTWGNVAASMREARYIHYSGVGEHENRQHIERHDFVLRSGSHAM